MVERELIRLAKQGDQSALNDLFKKYSKMIKHTGKKYFSQVEDQDDFEQIAKIGIWEAVEKYRLVPTFKAVIRGNKVIRFEMMYDKHQTDFGSFAFMYTRKNTNLSVRKERRRVKTPPTENLPEIQSQTYINSEDLDCVVSGVRKTLQKNILDGIMSLHVLDLSIKNRNEWTIKRMLSLSDDEFSSLKNKLTQLVRNQSDLVYTS